MARLGFTQSYTYFTWRTAKAELTEFALMHAERCDEARPNLFVNTPDILHESLQHGGRGMFAIRAALASTMAPTWGVYSGFELYEGEAVKPGSEEYLNSEKYELRPRDFAAAAATGNSLEPYITRLNEIRRAHPALQQLRNIAFHHVNNDQIIAYSKTDPATGDTVLVVITLDPWNAQEGTTALDLPALGLKWGDRFTVHDEITGGTWQWGQFNYVRLEPWHHVAHIFRVASGSPVAVGPASVTRVVPDALCGNSRLALLSRQHRTHEGGTTMAQEAVAPCVEANQFDISGPIVISYSRTSIAGKPLFAYRDAECDLPVHRRRDHARGRRRTSARSCPWSLHAEPDNFVRSFTLVVPAMRRCRWAALDRVLDVRLRDRRQRRRSQARPQACCTPTSSTSSAASRRPSISESPAAPRHPAPPVRSASVDVIHPRGGGRPRAAEQRYRSSSRAADAASTDRGPPATPTGGP